MKEDTKMNIKDIGIVKMVRGLSRPPQTREYKEARIAFERLSAPVAAILLPTIVVAVLFVVTAVDAGSGRKDLELEIVTADSSEILEDPVPPPPLDDPVDAPVEMPDLVDTPPPPLPNTDVTVTAAAAEPVPQKVTPLAALKIPSPVMAPRVSSFDTRSAAARLRLTSGKGMDAAVYGNATTEQAVLRALRWLKREQRADGSWAGPSPAAMAGFAVLTYLAHGETPASKEFGGTVARALDYLVTGMHVEKGIPRMRGSDGNEYAFLIAVYALCEAYGMTRNPNAKTAAEMGLRRIIAAQSPTGGWDYKLNRASIRDDLSFGGWALQAVKAGRMAGIQVEGLDTCVKKSVKYLKTRAFRRGGFGYCAGHAPNGLTATGCLALQLLGGGKDPEVRSALDFMRAWAPMWEKHPGGANAQYYSYYAAQCKYQAGMRKGATPADFTTWKKWNDEMRRLYPAAQIVCKETIPDAQGRPRAIGYWQNKDTYNAPVMGTCLCALQLMVYYRYLPTTSLHAAEVVPDIATLVRDRKDEIVPVVDI